MLNGYDVGGDMQKRLTAVMAVTLILIVMLHQRWLLPFLVSGVPVQLVKVNESSPLSFSESLVGTTDSWTIYNYRAEASKKYYDTVFNLWGREVVLDIAIDLTCGVSIFDVSTPVKVFEVQTDEQTMIVTYRYTFKVNIVWSGTITITEKSRTEWGFAPSEPTFEDLAMMIIKDNLIPDFNPEAFMSGNIILYIDAQSLAGSLASTLGATDYGVIGLFLNSHSADGLVTGTFDGVSAASKAYSSPSVAGTVVSRYSDSGLSVSCWSVSSTSYSSELTSEFANQFSDYASATNYFKIVLSSLGSQIVPYAEGTYPRYVQFVYEAVGTRQPAIKQQYRVDVAFKIPITPTPTVPSVTPTPKYVYELTVKDQVGNPLPATVRIDQQVMTADIEGKIKFETVESKTYTVEASIKVGDKEYSSTKTITLTSNITDTIVINRRFYWTFDIMYSDGTKPTGTLKLLGTKETQVVPVNNGFAEAYLLDDTYTVILEASPAITLGSIKVTNDGSLDVVLQKETGRVTTYTPTAYTPETTPYVQPTVPVQPEIPWELLPTTHIYLLTAVLVIIGVLAIYFRRR